MILTREIEIKINDYNYSYYEELGYDVYCGETIIIPIDLLSYGSQIKIQCKCDGCGIIKEVMFKNYVKYDNSWGEYYCRKCAEKKRKESLKEKYGVEYPYQNTEIKDKWKRTLLDNWGVDNPSKSVEIIKKKKKTKIDKSI
jgi:late competence protein required for DNA uptake (superfamily II DNA/RNA helicase)